MIQLKDGSEIPSEQTPSQIQLQAAIHLAYSEKGAIGVHFLAASFGTALRIIANEAKKENPPPSIEPKRIADCINRLRELDQAFEFNPLHISADDARAVSQGIKISIAVLRAFEQV